jgi:hypothetical protein
VCTTADREYAWEAWRLLDPQGTLFPLRELAWRMLCVSHPQKKDLLNVLRKQGADAAAVQNGGSPARLASDPQIVTDKGECRHWDSGCTGCNEWGIVCGGQAQWVLAQVGPSHVILPLLAVRMRPISSQ